MASTGESIKRGKGVPVTKRRTQQERKAESERAIIRTAQELFAKQGYVRTTLAEVGKLAGYTGGLVSHRFGSKQALLQEVVRRSSGRFDEDQLRPAVADKSATEAMDSFIETYLKEVALREGRVRALYVIMGEALGAVDEIKPEIAKLNAGFRDNLARMIRRGIDSGDYRQDLDPEEASMLVLGLIRGVTMQYLVDPKRVRLKVVLPLVQETVRGALAPR